MIDFDADIAGPGRWNAGDTAWPGAWRRLRRAWAAALLAAAPGLAGAGGFSVAPVRLFFGEKDRAVAVRLSNEGSAELVLHADVQAWSQDGQGRDRLEPSDDLVVSPTVLRIRPRAEQVVRLILVTPRDPARQMSYRLFLREQFPATAAQETEAARLPITLTLSLPVFITPARARHALQCGLAAPEVMPPTAVCENRGRAHARLGRIDLRNGDALVARHEGSLYLLPGARLSIPLAADPGVPGARGGTLSALLDGGESLSWRVADPLPTSP
jgi:fimbrial chaperone protein